jgi:hypothetical protein
MPQTFWFTIRPTTTIILVEDNLNMIKGDLRHMDRSTTITNRDAFNNIELESTVTQQMLLSTTSLGKSRYGEDYLISRKPQETYLPMILLE